MLIISTFSAPGIAGKTSRFQLARVGFGGARLRAGALAVKRGDNNVATFMRNVLNAFLKPGPLPGSEYVGVEKLWC
jgi:hypothetical protein